MDSTIMNLMDRLIPREEGKIIGRYYYPGLSNPVAYRQIGDMPYEEDEEDEEDEEFTDVKVLYNEKTADMMVVDYEGEIFFNLKVSNPKKIISHANHLSDGSTDRFEKLFSAKDRPKWRKLTEKFMVIGVRFVDNTYGFIRWPEPDDEAHSAYMYQGGEWVENPFVECTDEQEPDLKRAKKGS